MRIPSAEEIADRLAIESLITAYTIEGDRARFDAFVQVFTEDAELILPQWRAVGRRAILAAMRHPDNGIFGERRPSFMRHHLTTRQIVLAGDAADGRTYFIKYSDIGADHAGVYVDRCVRESGQWLIARREIRVDWQAEASLYPPLVALSRTAVADRPVFGS